jgi:hypothetical protein
MTYPEQFVSSTWEDVARDCGFMPEEYFWSLFWRVYRAKHAPEELLSAADKFLGKKDERN